MIHFNLKEVAPGEAIRADDWNALVGLLRELTDESNARELSVGEGLELHKSSSGSTLLLDVGDFREEPEPTEYEHPFKVTAQIGKGTNGIEAITVRINGGTVFSDASEWDSVAPALIRNTFEAKSYEIEASEPGKMYTVKIPMYWKTNYERTVLKVREAVDLIASQASDAGATLDSDALNTLRASATTVWAPAVLYPPMPEGSKSYETAIEDVRARVESLSGESGAGAFESSFPIATIVVSSDGKTVSVTQITHADITISHRHGNF